MISVFLPPKYCSPPLFCERLSVGHRGKIHVYRLTDMNKYKIVSLLGQFHPSQSFPLLLQAYLEASNLPESVCKANSAI